jgi:hypothetical protein
MIGRGGQREADGPTALVVDHVADPDRCREVIAALMDEYERYVESEHAICPACPVVRTGPLVVRSMLEWKATDRDGQLGRWTVDDVLAYLLDHLPRAVAEDRGVLRNAPTCAKDLVYFMSDRGTLAGDSVDALIDATDGVLDAVDSANGDRADGAPAERDDARTSGSASNRYARSEPLAQNGVKRPSVKAGSRGHGGSARRAKRKAAQTARRQNRR